VYFAFVRRLPRVGFSLRSFFLSPVGGREFFARMMIFRSSDHGVAFRGRLLSAAVLFVFWLTTPLFCAASSSLYNRYIASSSSESSPPLDLFQGQNVPTAQISFPLWRKISQINVRGGINAPLPSLFLSFSDKDYFLVDFDPLQ